MSKIKPILLACDFETTVDNNTREQKSTEVWAAASVRLKKEQVIIHNNINEFMEYASSIHKYTILFFHNLKFDGSFILSYLIENGYTLAMKDNKHLKSKFKLSHKEMIYSINGKGQWYTLCFKYNNNLVEVRDSLKLMPFSLRSLAKAFNTKHQKLEMDYKGNHYAGCKITADEKSYIENDVLVLKEALEFMFSQEHNKITIGSCCMEEFKKEFGDNWTKFFPDLTKIETPDEIREFGDCTADAYLRRSYRGGWCYQVNGKEGLHRNGITADVNSLYPSVMHSSSGNRYPFGKPTFFIGNIPDALANNPNMYYFVRIKCRFKIKKGYLPFVQIKGKVFYDGTDCLEDSDFSIFDRETKEWKKVRYLNKDGEIIEAKPTMTFTCKDYELFKKHYYVMDEEVLDGCYFNTEIGIFDNYIDRYAEIKKTSKGAMRTLAKLFLNNLYGKFSTSPDNSFKLAKLGENGELKFETIECYEKDTIFIAIGSAVTSYAKNFTITAAQKNYYGPDKPGFIYADTDSIHCDISADEVKGITIHPTNFGCWALEAFWDDALFIRQKTYIEHVTHEDCEKIDNPYYNVKCAGLPERCKKLFVMSMNEEKLEKRSDGMFYNDKNEKFNNDEAEFVSIKRRMEDFKIGIRIPSKLKPKQIKGGVVLVDEYFTMR